MNLSWVMLTGVFLDLFVEYMGNTSTEYIPDYEWTLYVKFTGLYLMSRI